MSVLVVIKLSRDEMSPTGAAFALVVLVLLFFGWHWYFRHGEIISIEEEEIFVRRRLLKARSIPFPLIEGFRWGSHSVFIDYRDSKGFPCALSLTNTDFSGDQWEKLRAELRRIQAEIQIEG